MRHLCRFAAHASASVDAADGWRSSSRSRSRLGTRTTSWGRSTSLLRICADRGGRDLPSNTDGAAASVPSQRKAQPPRNPPRVGRSVATCLQRVEPMLHSAVARVSRPVKRNPSGADPSGQTSPSGTSGCAAGFSESEQPGSDSISSTREPSRSLSSRLRPG